MKKIVILGVLLAFLTACQTPNTAMINPQNKEISVNTNNALYVQQSLIHTWQLNKAVGFIQAYDTTTLTFEKERGYLNAGCNNISFNYNYDNNKLTINHILMTKMACGNRFENELLKFFNSPITVKIEQAPSGLSLFLSDGNNKNLSFSFVK